MTKVIHIENTMFRYTEHMNGVVSIYVYGSNDKKDWLWNFRTRRVLHDKVRVNKWDRVEALRVLRWLKARDPSLCSPLFVIKGHSRGGGPAAIVAYELAKKQRSTSLVLYGAKRTGNRAFIKALHEHLCSATALRNPGDFVPWLPPWYSQIKTTRTNAKLRWPIKAHLDYPHI